MNKDRDEKIGELAQRKLGGTSYSDLRAELRNEGYSPDEIGVLIRKADEKVLASTLSGGKQDRSRQWYRAGLFTAIAGLLISGAFHAGIILQNLPSLIAYAPFFAGIVLMVYGKWLQQKRKTPGKHGTGSIRRKRPYK